MTNHHIFKVFENTICLAYIPETVMKCDDYYVNKPKNTNAWGIPSMETYLTRIMIRKKDISKIGYSDSTIF
jgi:hypothetical protein